MPEKPKDLWKRLLPPQTEEEHYKSYFHKDSWNIAEFGALVGGLDPETFLKNQSLELSNQEFKKRKALARKILKRFFADADKGIWNAKDLVVVGDNIYLSTWKYIKWLAENQILTSPLFWNELPFLLMELYVEFRPVNSILRKASRFDRRYHKALYLDHARKLLNSSRDILPPVKIFKHPAMQNVQRYIRELGGNYTKRTIITSWLPTLVPRSRGRPKNTT